MKCQETVALQLWCRTQQVIHVCHIHVNALHEHYFELSWRALRTGTVQTPAFQSWRDLLWTHCVETLFSGISACLQVQFKLLVCFSTNSFELDYWKPLLLQIFSLSFHWVMAVRSWWTAVAEKPWPNTSDPGSLNYAAYLGSLLYSAVLSFSKILQVQAFSYLIKTMCIALNWLSWHRFVLEKMGQLSDVSDGCNSKMQLTSKVSI